MIWYVPHVVSPYAFLRVVSINYYCVPTKACKIICSTYYVKTPIKPMTKYENLYEQMKKIETCSQHNKTHKNYTNNCMISVRTHKELP